MAIKMKSPQQASSSTKLGTNSAGRLGVVVLSLAVMAGLVFLLSNIDKNAVATIPVVRVSSDIQMFGLLSSNDGGPKTITNSAGARVTLQPNIEKYDMLVKEYESYGTTVITNIDGSTETVKRVVTWDEREKVVNKYASYFIPKGTVLFLDSVVSELPRKNPYLSQIESGKELLRLSVGDAGAFGSIVVPGDRLNIRYTFTETKKAFVNGIETEVEGTKQDSLFKDVPIVDILNAKGESVYDIYTEVLSMPEAQMSAALADDDFISRVKPEAFLLIVTPEEVDRYTRTILADSISYTITLLPRIGDSAIIDSIANLNKKAQDIASQNVSVPVASE